MKGIFYIISGWYDTTGRAPYRRLCEIATRKGYKVIKINPEWDEPLSEQIFPVTCRDVIFGFSMGAILACMVGQQHECHKLLLGSMTPVLDLSRATLRVLGSAISKDLKNFNYGGVLATYFYGDRELDESLEQIREIAIQKTGSQLKIIPNVCHNLSPEYIEQIAAEL